MSLVSESLVFASRTDPGRVRKQNEDAILVVPEYGLAVLADGMGGYNAGEIASAITIALLGNDLGERFALKNPSANNGDGRSHAEAALDEVLVKANGAVHDAARSQAQYSGMGTTVVAAVFHKQSGDGRPHRRFALVSVAQRTDRGTHAGSFDAARADRCRFDHAGTGARFAQSQSGDAGARSRSRGET